MAKGIFRKALRWVGIGAAAGIMAAGVPDKAPAQNMLDNVQAVQMQDSASLPENLQKQLNMFIKAIARMKEQKEWTKSFEATNGLKYRTKRVWIEAYKNNDKTRSFEALKDWDLIINEEVKVLQAMWKEYESLKKDLRFIEALELLSHILHHSRIIADECSEMHITDMEATAKNIYNDSDADYKNTDKLRYVQEQGIIGYKIIDIQDRDRPTKKFLKLIGICSDTGAAKKKIAEILKAELAKTDANPETKISYHFDKKNNGFYEASGFVEVISLAQAQNILKK